MNKLKIGVFKYPEICIMMGWEKKAGNTKIAQLKELETYCKFGKVGTKFNIEEVYSNDVIFKPEAKARKGKYNVEVGSSILAVVTSRVKDTGVVYLTQRELILETALANKRLFDGYMAEGFTRLEIRSYKDVAKKMSYKAIESGLNWLNSSRVLKSDKVRVAKVFNMKTEEYEIREVNSDEDALLFEGEQVALSELGYDNIFTVMVNNEFKMFGDMVSKYIYENYGIDIEFYYSTIKFTVTKFSKERGIQLASKKVSLKKDIWDKTHKALVESAIKRKNYNYEASLEALETYRNGMKEGFEIENDFVNVVYAYPNYEENFKSLDIIYRK